MAVLLEDIVKSVEQLLKLIGKNSQEQAYVDPTLDPVLLVPGIAGSILNAVDEKTGKEERVWVRILGADHEFCTKLWSIFDPTTGQFSDFSVYHVIYTVYFFVLVLVTSWKVIGGDCVHYFHDMIVEMLKWGYQEGTTLFGFGYDFRQSNRFQGTMEGLAAKLESVYTASGGRKITIISHSMGGLLVKCFMGLHSDIFEKYVKNWIAIAAPFRGAPGYITSTLLNGASFVEGWKQNFFISKWSMHQMLIECPSIYELMACLDFPWEHIPLLEIWRKMSDSDGNSTTMLESYPPIEAVSIFMEALSSNKVNYDGTDISLPFNLEVLKWANETRKLLSCAKVPNRVKFYNIYGTNNETPHSVCYGSEDAPVSDLQQLPALMAKYINVDGDGTVPMESAKADGLQAEARVGVPGDHRGILCDRHVFRILKHWLMADHDPYYNPVNDFVVLPTLFEIESHKASSGLQVTSVKEDWEIIGENQEQEQDSVAEKKPLVGSISVSRVGGDKSLQEEARATITVHPQRNGKKHVGLKGMSISAGA
ncbi:lecithin-cholesterol acyltransferase-like 4 [Olea europaea subsp. europaea]|uniref:Lecithin-cholesterol acyltransferase-like 4 n=1 Tax=Olea europaea subsp. europaea TaxID=158383 RepID=A0A8S0UJX3_OLEEU|nr:lecithin-cholesterol acyltransferase-like 4 [Olea europaea subsp. europaea]